MSQLEQIRRRRCAIYTRKSTDERLDRDFNSLDSQREVCSAYVTSQRHKAWSELATRYDDAAQSGGTIDRPALQQLMRDIESNRIDVVVIYKIDRLTRSLADFVRLIDVFDRHQVSFVSVTQSFDTSDSMGRLVLNILLTFAQFEREMIADRIRDKAGAMRRKGKHTGGTPPYGYDVVDRRLVVNPVEADKVRSIYQRFLALGSYQAVQRELKAEGFCNKRWTTRAGKVRGGTPASNGMIYNLLGNPLYIGRVFYGGSFYEGEHDAILTEETWQAAAAAALRARRAMFRPCKGPSSNILLGLLFDSHGRRMVICDERKRHRPYRYYASEQSRQAAAAGLKRYRTRADELEQLVLAALKDVFSDREKMRSALLALGRHGPEVEQLPRRGKAACRHLETASLERKRELLVTLIARGELSRDRLKLMLRCAELERFLRWDGHGLFRGDRPAWSHTEPVLLLDLPVSAVRFERSLVMPIEQADPERTARVQAGLVALVHEARKAQAMVDAGRDTPVHELAHRFGRMPGFFARILRLNYLAPDIIAAMLDGTQPAGLTRKRLVNANLPMDWALQRQLFGFAARPDHQRGEPRY
jgi:site-specific DNA recombinase